MPLDVYALFVILFVLFFEKNPHVTLLSFQAQIVAKFLQTVKRTDVPIGVGINQDSYVGPLYGWAEDYNLKSYPGIFLLLFLLFSSSSFF